MALQNYEKLSTILLDVWLIPTQTRQSVIVFIKITNIIKVSKNLYSTIFITVNLN